MANVTATGSISNVNVTSTISNITVSDTLSNIAVSNISSQTVNVAVSSTTTSVNVAALASVANSTIRSAISANTSPGGLASLTYNDTTGVMLLTGPSATDVYSVLSNTSPITFNQSTGVIGLEQTLDDLTLKKYQETVVANGNISGNVSFNITNGTVHTATLTGNVTNITLSNISSGGSAFLILDQGPLGGHILDTTSNFTNWRWVGNVTTLNTTPNSTSVIAVHYDGTNYNAALNRFDGTVINSDDITEGSTNLFYTDARSRAAISVSTGSPSGNGALTYSNSTGVFSFTPADTSVAIALTDLSVTTNSPSGNGALSYNNTTGVFAFTPSDVPDTTDELTEGSTNLYFTNARANTVIGTNTTDNLSEGSTNLYYTTARANAAIVDYIGTASNAPFAFGGNITVSGDVIVSGNLDYENVTDLYVQDQKITLNANAATDATVEIIANRPVAGNNTLIRWNETSDVWQFTNDGSTFYNIPASTSDLAEGTNLYYTTDRANTAIDAKLSGGYGITYTGGVIETTNADVRALISATGNINYDAANGIISESLTTTDITEGDNLYYTTDRANTAIGAYQGNISTAGTITATGDITTTGFFVGDLDGAVLADVYNATGSTLTKGQAVYLTGVNTGDNPHVALADADDATKMPALGIVYSNIANASVGQVTTSGVMNFASHGFALGSDLFIGTTAGGLSVTAPTGESGLIQKIGKVVSSNHIIVQGAFRTNATPNLNQGKIFLGDTNNQTLSVTPSTNFKTTGNAFEIANALTNVNSIQSESANDKFTFKALLGGAATETNTGNITSDGYEVIIDSSHTYASSGNVAQKSGSTNNLNGYAVSGSFTNGSTVFSITGVTELKNVYNETGNIDGTNNNVSLTGDMVANMIPDNFSAVDGDQYPLPAGTVLSSANTTALVFSQAAVASQTFANTAPIAIVHGGRDTTTGQIISFVSQDDAVADGTQVVTIDSGPNGGIIAFSNTGETPVSPETTDSITIGLPSTPSIPVGTAVTFANVTGTGASNINGQTLYIKRDVFGDSFNYTLTTDAAGTTTATMTAFGLVSFDTGNGDITYSVAQSTSTINKSRLYVKDTYGYPKVGPKEQDFTYSIGSASDYTIDYSAATTSTRGRTSLEATKQVLKAPIGLTIGNATMSNRGDNDAFTNFGLNFVWDGKTPYGSEYAGSSNTTLVPQMLFKNYTDNTFASGSSGLGRGGPRLFFASSTGNIDTNEFDKYPRKSQEIGRMTFWGPTQDVGDGMSTVNPAGFISATAHADWTSSNKLEMGFVANGNGFNSGDVFLKYIDGKVVIASGNNGTTNQAIHLAPATTTTNGNIAQHYATLGHTWANVNYANVSAATGSKFTINQGGADGTSSGDVTFSIDRDYIPSTVTQTVDTPSNGGFIAGSEVGDTPNDVMIAIWAGGASHTIADGTAISFTGVTGPGNANINGTTFYSKTSPNLGVNATQLYLDSGLSNIANVNVIGIGPAFDPGGTGNGTAEWTETGTSARDYTFNLPTGSENLVLSTNGTTHSTFYNNGNLQVAGNIEVGAYKLPTADGSNGQAITTDGNGALSFTTISGGGSGTVTSVGSGNGLTGGPITTSGNLAVGAGAGITVNSTNVAINYGANQPFTANVDAANVIISNTVYVDNLQPYTGGGTLTFTSPRMTDVKIGNIFYPDGAVSDYSVLVGYANATGSWESISTPIENTNIKLKQFGETVVALGNQSGNIAAVAGFNAANASIFSLTATGGITISQIPNVVEGGSYTIKVTQDGTGSHALTSTFKFAGGDKTLSTAGGSIDVINVVYDGTDYLATLSKAYA